MSTALPKTLFFDIETLPAPPKLEPTLRELYEAKPGRSRSFDDYLRGTSLSGNWGRILCIGVAVNDEPVDILSGDEPTILEEFWNKAQGATRFVGHNALEFDIPFISKRSVIHRVKPTVTIPMQRYSNDVVFDTMRAWDHWASRSGTGLHQLALILGLESSKQGIDGSQVYDYYQAGRVDEIYNYCKRDVELTRQVYRRLTFQRN